MILTQHALLHVKHPHQTKKSSDSAEVTVSQMQRRKMSAYHATVTPRGFSLIELLVVISIIALLASMLMVAFKLVQEGARGVNCLSNLRQMAMSIEVYAIDYEQKPPCGNWGQPGFPLVVGASYLAKSQIWPGAIQVGTCQSALQTVDRRGHQDLPAAPGKVCIIGRAFGRVVLGTLSPWGHPTPPTAIISMSLRAKLELPKLV